MKYALLGGNHKLNKRSHNRLRGVGSQVNWIDSLTLYSTTRLGYVFERGRMYGRPPRNAINQFCARSIGICSDAAWCQGDYSRSIGFVRQSGQRHNTHMPCETAGNGCPGYWTNLLVSRPLHTNALCGASKWCSHRFAAHLHGINTCREAAEQVSSRCLGLAMCSS